MSKLTTVWNTGRTSPGPATSSHTAPAAPSPEVLPQSLIGKDLQLRGKDIQVVVEGRLRIDGHVSGEVYGHEVVIGPDARIRGRVVSRKMVIDGEIDGGEIFAYDVELGSSARVTADIHHASLKVVDGAQFEGRARRIGADAGLPTPGDG